MIEVEVFNSSSNGNCYRLISGSSQLLIEAGIKLSDIRKKTGHQLGRLDGVLVSHEHGDHAKSIMQLIDNGVAVYMSEGTKAALGDVAKYAEVVRPDTIKNIGKWRIQPFRTQHDAAEPLGFVIEDGEDRLLFATDTFFLPYKFLNLTQIMVECNYALDILDKNLLSGRVTQSQAKRLLTSHFSLHNLKSYLRNQDLSRVKVIYLMHISSVNGDQERFKKEIQSVTGKPVKICEA